ncbi:MAG: BREX system P-loop protein BrxC, partial [Deltaproteobacteria bacterium]|nr:BREX system P-loop protein BrxC [Deltaproteobacteria bacterium]
MGLKNIFKKPVDRPIEGVIKADDEAGLRLEMEEYVLTNEVARRLESFLDAYNNYTGANGVWISGFFGSGKSHLLKILALLLENRKLDGSNALELFLPKCGDNEILRGDLQRAVRIPSQSILFNIDQKADVISKTQTDALLAVFVKVFDETCGFYGKQPYVAQFERELERDDLFTSFKEEFSRRVGKDWEWGRSRPNRVAAQIDVAFNQVTGQNQTDVLDKYRQDYRLSIEDFAEQVDDYIRQRPPGFRLNFFVDEVGQYVAENAKLMTNLQTIAESLATKCRGRAWIVVTAQEDMNNVVGEMTAEQGNDFSKIQARFANRLKLTSADVAEVIQKRLLLKNELGVDQLSDLYHVQANNFKTLFDFADGAQSYRNFQDRDHFIHSYPFIPYQFALFQAAIQNLSLHNAFEGRHSSVGERSMLGVFQQVAIQIGGHEIGQLATFDLMFEGIRSSLKAQIQRSIILADKHLASPFALSLLKALFLVKYVKGFNATVRNLCVLMYDCFDRDLPALKSRVEEALSLLEKQTYIQRNGDLFEYLTDEEKDVEEEIKNTEVEANEVAGELEKIIFEHTIRQRKIRYTENGQDYTFSQKLDDRLYGREYELAINVISPFHENFDNVGPLRNQSLGRDELMVLLPADERLYRDLILYKQTEKYIRQNISVTQQDNIRRILDDKGFQNRERYTELQSRVKKLLGAARMLVLSYDVESNSEDPQTRIFQGFSELIARVYPHLRMLRTGKVYSENDLPQYLDASRYSLFGKDEVSLAESEQEILAFIQSNSRSGLRTTLKGVMEKFERKPYGWYYAAILCNLANLCARGKVEVRCDGNLIEENNLEKTLRNTHAHGNIVLEPQIAFTGSQVRALKEFYEDFFDTPPRSGETKALGRETGAALAELKQTLSRLQTQAARYPFLKALTDIQAQLTEVIGKPYAWYLTDFSRRVDELLDLKEKHIDPLLRFMNGPQKEIFDQAAAFIQSQEANFSYLAEGDGGGSKVTEAASPESLINKLSDPQCFKGDHMQQIKFELDDLRQQIAKRLKVESERAEQKVADLKNRLGAMPEFQVLSDSQQAELRQPFAEFSASLGRQTLIAVIRDNLRRFEEK